MSRPSTKKRQSTKASTFSRVSSDSRKRVLPTSKKTTTSTKAAASHTTPDAAGPSRTPHYSTRSRTKAASGHSDMVHDDAPPPSSIRRRQNSKGKALARAPRSTNDAEDDASKFTLVCADLKDFEYFSEALLRDREDTGNMRCTVAVSEENGNDTIAIVFHQKNMGVPTINWNTSSSSPTDSIVDIWDYMRTASENDTAYRIVHELKALRSTNYFSLRDELSDDADQAAAKARILDFQRQQQDIFARQDKSAAAQGSLDALRNTDMVVDGIYGRIAQHFSSPALESRYQKNMLFRAQDKILRELGIPLEERYPSRTELEDDAVLSPPLSPGDEAQPISVPFPFRSNKRARDALESDADDDDAGTTSRHRKRPRRQAPASPRPNTGARTVRSGAATRRAGPAGGSTANAQAFPTPPTDEPAAGPSTAPESQRTTNDRKGKGKGKDRAAAPAGRFSQYIKDEDLSDIALGMSLGWKILTGAGGPFSSAQIAEGKATADAVEAGAVPKRMDAVGLEALATRIVESDDATVHGPTKRRRTTRKR